MSLYSAALNRHRKQLSFARDPCVSVQEMAGQDDCAECGEAEEDRADDGVDEAEEGRADTVGHEANDDDQRSEPSHQAGGDHQDSPSGGLGTEDGMGKGKPVGGDANPIKGLRMVRPALAATSATRCSGMVPSSQCWRALA